MEAKLFFERGPHRKGCPCKFCANKGKIADYWKKKVSDAASGSKKKKTKKGEEEPKDMTEGLMPAIRASLGETNVQSSQVKLSKGSTIGKANRAFTNMTSKQQATPGWKPQASMKAEAEATNQLGRMKGFKNKSEGETNNGKPLPKTRAGESAQRVAAALLDS